MSESKNKEKNIQTVIIRQHIASGVQAIWSQKIFVPFDAKRVIVRSICSNEINAGDTLYLKSDIVNDPFMAIVTSTVFEATPGNPATIMGTHIFQPNSVHRVTKNINGNFNFALYVITNAQEDIIYTTAAATEVLMQLEFSD